MNRATFEQAQEFYEAQDYARALDIYNSVLADTNFPLSPGEIGLVYHQIGNCFVKLSNYGDAITAYTNATSDQSYVSLGTVFYNLGMAYAYMNDFTNAINNFNTAIATPNYRSKFKAYTAMGNALMKSGKSADAAVAFRNAAMDTHNTDPTRALLNLGVCFMALGQPQNAITVYQSTFQYNMSNEFLNRLNANLGQAYVADGQMQKAVDAFENALRDKTYKLSDSASVDYQRAIAAISKGEEEVDPSLAGPAAAAAAGMAAGVAAANPATAQAADNNFDNQAANTQTVPEDNGAFAPINDAPANVNNGQAANNAEPDEFQKWSESTKDAAYNKIEKKHPVKTFFIVLLFVLAGLIIAGSVLFCFGFGLPSQEMIAKELLANPIESKDKVFANNLSDLKKSNMAAIVTQDANAHVDGVYRSVNDSVTFITGKTSQGADVQYELKMQRDFVG